MSFVVFYSHLITRCGNFDAEPPCQSIFCNAFEVSIFCLMMTQRIFMKVILTCAAFTLIHTSTIGRLKWRSDVQVLSIVSDTVPIVSGYILGPDQGDAIGNHLIKVDSARGSIRLGMGIQSLRPGRSIPLHMHEGEDEILFVHAGTGKGVVGSDQKQLVPGMTLYIPQGVWHGVQSNGKGMKVLWVVSPPNFPRSLREIDSVGKLGRHVSGDEITRIALKHKQKDSRYFLAEILAHSAWDGGKEFGRVEFDNAGLMATFMKDGQVNTLVIHDSSNDGLGFQGQWLKPGGSKTVFEIRYDFDGGKKLTIILKERPDQKIIWHRLDK
jgi:mannose-6-phosphate isomerase-like protein (cupin superfamily)